jgi:hypothetical protein
MRRAAHVFRFGRPDDDQRRALVSELLSGSNVASGDIEKVVSLTGPGADKPHGCTYSDIRQRLVPEAVLDAVSRDMPLVGSRMIELAESFEPTSPLGADT